MLQDLDEGVPRHRAAQSRRSPPTCWRTCATPRTCSRCSASCSPSYHVTDAQTSTAAPTSGSIPDDPDQASGASRSRRTTCSVQMPGQTAAGVLPDHDVRPAEAPDTWPRSWPWTPNPGRTTARSRCCSCPADTTIPGPAQVQNNFETDPTSSAAADAAARQRLVRGRVRQPALAAGRRRPALRRAGLHPGRRPAGYPLLKKVLVGFGDRTSPSRTRSARRSPSCSAPAAGTVKPPPDRADQAPDRHRQQQLVAAIAEAQAAFTAGEQALAKGDWAAYGAAQDRLSKALAKATAAERDHRHGPSEPPRRRPRPRGRSVAGPPDPVCPAPASPDLRLALRRNAGHRGVEQLGSSLGS